VYREQPSRVPGAFIWSSVSTGTEVRVLPDGCMDLLWDGRSVVIAGPDTHAQLFAARPGSVLTGLRFARVTPRVLGLRMITDRQVPLDAVWAPAEVRRLTERSRKPDPADLRHRVALLHRPTTAPASSNTS
jgi:hypothetical protein